jgi:hypothetical protein
MFVSTKRIAVVEFVAGQSIPGAKKDAPRLKAGAKFLFFALEALKFGFFLDY